MIPGFESYHELPSPDVREILITVSSDANGRALYRAVQRQEQDAAIALANAVTCERSLLQASWLALSSRQVPVYESLAGRVNPGSCYGGWLLYAACERGDEAAVAMLLSQPRERSQRSLALIHAARGGNPAIVKRLLRQGCNAKERGSQALLEACAVRSLACVQMLLPLSSQIVAAAHVLPFAAALGNLAIVQCLIRSDLPDECSYVCKAVQVAQARGQQHVVEALLAWLDSADRGKALRPSIRLRC